MIHVFYIGSAIIIYCTDPIRKQIVEKYTNVFHSNTSILTENDNLNSKHVAKIKLCFIKYSVNIKN